MELLDPGFGWKSYLQLQCERNDSAVVTRKLQSAVNLSFVIVASFGGKHWG